MRTKPFGTFVKVEDPDAFDFPYTNINSFEAIEESMAILKEEEYIAFDIETTGLDPIGPDAMVKSIGFASMHFLGGIVFDEEVESDKLAGARVEFMMDVLDLPCPKIAHNGLFDVTYLRIAWGVKTRNYKYDTLLGFYLMDESGGVRRGLKNLGKEFTPFPVIEFPEELLTGDIDPGTLLRYNCSDCRITLYLFEMARKELERLKLLKLWALITKASVVLHNITITGIEIDTTLLEEKYEKLVQERNIIAAKMRKTAKNKGVPDLNFGSPTQLRSFLFDVLGLPTGNVTPTGKPSTDAATISGLDHPFPKALLKWRSMVKYIDTYYENYRDGVDKNNRIHPQYKLWGTRTGRSSSQNPNIQNVPRDNDMREIFVAREGWWLVEADYSQCELRVMAMYAKEDKLKEAFLAGRDPHREVAAFLFNKDLDDVTGEERRKAKTMNFAILYGMGAHSLSDLLDIPDIEAQQLINTYYSRFDKIADWVARQHEEAIRNKQVVSFLHRVRRFPELSQGASSYAFESSKQEVLKQAVNAVIQGTASDLALMGLVRVAKKLENMKSKLVMFVHDSLMVESPRSELKVVQEILRVEMTEFSQRLPIPLEIEIKIGADWGHMEEKE